MEPTSSEKITELTVILMKNLYGKTFSPEDSSVSFSLKVVLGKKVFTVSLLLLDTRVLSRDKFYTLLQEAASIVNHTPLSEV